MVVDHYAGAGRRWATGAALVYGPIARQLVGRSPHPLGGRLVLDAGAGTGVASAALAAEGAHPLAMDLSYDMLAYDPATRPPGVVADVRALPLPDDAVDDSVAAFVLNHLVHPEDGLAELVRVTRRNGALLACVYSNASRSEMRDLVRRNRPRTRLANPRLVHRSQDARDSGSWKRRQNALRRTRVWAYRC
jgi:ubiquinone/menaquinone biosynthesis C-methylase UbiE